MNLQEIKKSRNFTIEKTWSDDIRLQFKHSNINKAREAHNLFKTLNASMDIDDVNGGKAVGGYYASGTISKDRAKELQLAF